VLQNDRPHDSSLRHIGKRDILLDSLLLSAVVAHTPAGMIEAATIDSDSYLQDMSS
jgi:hypothetical protein